MNQKDKDRSIASLGGKTMHSLSSQHEAKLQILDLWDEHSSEPGFVPREFARRMVAQFASPPDSMAAPSSIRTWMTDLKADRDKKREPKWIKDLRRERATKMPAC